MLTKFTFRSLKAFDESKHPRANDGKFDETVGGGGNEAESKPAADETAGGDDPKWMTKRKRKPGEVAGYYDYGHLEDAKGAKRATELSDQQLGGLEQHHQEAASIYTGSDYKEINGGLRGKGKLSGEHKQIVRHMDEALDKSTLPENTILYRGMNLTPEKLADIKPGTRIKDAAYTSTTLSQSKTEMYANGEHSVVMRIKAPKGTHALAVENVSNYPTEKEVVLPRNSQFEITGVKKDKYTNRLYVDVRIVANE